MHIPDGLIPITHAMVYLAISLVFLAYSFINITKKADMGERLVLTGVLTAMTVVATSVTVPSPIGIPMHFFIITLVVLILGPLSGFIVSFLALLIQAFSLGMGGVTTLGINVLDMGIILSITVYIIYNLFSNINDKMAIFLSTVTGILAATLAQIIILALANTTSFEVLIASLLPYYLMIGIIEGVANILILEFISKTNNSILEIEKV